jgi:hypothetical protein
MTVPLDARRRRNNGIAAGRHGVSRKGHDRGVEKKKYGHREHDAEAGRNPTENAPPLYRAVSPIGVPLPSLTRFGLILHDASFCDAALAPRAVVIRQRDDEAGGWKVTTWISKAA